MSTARRAGPGRPAASPGDAAGAADRAGPGRPAARPDGAGSATRAAAEPAHTAPAAGAGPAADPLVLRVAAGLLVAVAAVGLAVIEAFLVPLRVGSVRIPVSVLLAVAGNVLLTRLAGRQTGSVVAAALQPVLWLVTVVVLSLPRPEGDVIVEGTVTGLVFLFAGAVAGAYGVAAEITRLTRRDHPVHR